jgi:hypothetical protein
MQMLSLILKLAFTFCCGILSLLFPAAIPGMLQKGLFLSRITSHCDTMPGKDVSFVPTPEMIS